MSVIAKEDSQVNRGKLTIPECAVGSHAIGLKYTFNSIDSIV